MEAQKKFTVIGIGEILWDLLPDGKILGGAPVNFAYHAAQMGGEGVAISAVGNDELGSEIIRSIDEKGVVNCLAIKNKPTGTVGVTLKNGKPDYTIFENVAWDFIELTAGATENIGIAHAICFGTLAQRNPVSHAAIMDALRQVPPGCLKVYDINLRQKYYTLDLITESLKIADVFKINDEEIDLLKHMLGLKGSETEICGQLMAGYGIKYLALTKGEHGSYLLKDDEISFEPTPWVDVVDTVGAGDSFTAAMVMGILNNWELKKIHEKAVTISAFVCTQKGATPILPAKLIG